MTLKGIFGRASYADEQRRWLYGRLGRLADDGTTYIIEVPYREKYLWVRMGANGDQAPMVAYNKGGVALRGNLPVRMRRDNGVLTIYEVDAALLTTDPNAPATPGGVAIHHHRSVAGTPEAANPLSFELEAKQIDRGRVWSAGGMSVTINAFRYYFNGAWQTWEGGDLDLTANIPGDAGEHAWVLVGIDPATNTAVAVTGTSVIYATELEYADLDAIAFGEYIPCGAVKVRDDDTALTDVTDYVDAHGWHNGGPAKAATATVYVAKTGADTLDGLHPERPKLTIGAAITAADALITAGADKVRVEVLDGGTYSENLVLGPDMILHAPAATVVGTLQLDDGCSALLDRQYPSASNDQVLISRITTGGGEISSYRANIVDGRGVGGAVTGTINIQNEAETGVIFCWVGQVFVAQGGFGVRDSGGAGFGHVHFIFNDLYLAGNNAIGLRNTNAATNLIGYIDHILEIGTPTGTKGVQILASGGVVKLTASEIIADEAYDIAGGTFYLSCPKVTGTLTGTPTSIQSNRLVITDESRPTTLTATAEKTTPVDADKFFEGDSADSGFLKWVSWANIKATLNAVYQPLDAELTAIAGLTSAADRVPYFTGLGTAALATFTAFGRSLVAAVDAAAARTLLALGTMALEAATAFLRLAGVAGGQTAYGGTAASNAMTLEGTSHATKGPILLNPSGGEVGLGTTAPNYLLHLKQATAPFIAIQRSDATTPNGWILGLGTSAGNITYGSAIQFFNGETRFYQDATPTNTTDNLTQLFTIANNGWHGIGVTAPKGVHHIYDGTGGKMFVTKTGIVGSAQTIIPNGTGDVVRAANLFGIAYDGTTTWTISLASGGVGLIPGGTVTVGSAGVNTIGISCAADGSVTVIRTAGGNTWSLGLQLVWL